MSRHYRHCAPEEVVEAVETAYPFSVGGFLFFHNECRYTPGVTPLALWLTPELLQERLGIDIPPFPDPIQLVLPPADPSMHAEVHGVELMDEVPNDDAIVDSADLSLEALGDFDPDGSGVLGDFDDGSSGAYIETEGQPKAELVLGDDDAMQPT